MATTPRQPDDVEFDCQRCGACCCAGLDVLLMEGEVDTFERDPRLRPLMREHPRIAAFPLYFLQRDAADRCVAFAGSQDACRCTIYAQRPMLCRELEAGSDGCREARRKLGLPA